MLLSTIYLSIISSVLSREYIYVDKDLTQSNAEAYCAATYPIHNGHLAAIETEAENDEVAALCPDQKGTKDGCSIGLEQTGAKSSTWTDGELVTYTNWGKNQPKFEAITHPTSIIKPGDSAKGGGTWRVVRDIEFPFICQKDLLINVCGTYYTIVNDRLFPGERMYTGEALVSINRLYVAVLQYDGNFVVIQISDCTSSWAAGVWGEEERYLELQVDGNVVLYSAPGGAGTDVWSSSTNWNNAPMYLIIQNDGNLVAYTESSVAYWNTGIERTSQAFVNYFYESTAQQSLSLIATLIGAFTCILLLCIYVIKHRRNKEYEPLLN